jgi:hypothetical protein
MTAFTPNTLKGPFDTITAGSATVTLTAASAGADTFVCTGRDLILVQNSHAVTAYTVTITSIADEKGRTGDITTYSLAAGEIAVFGCGLTNSPGWKNASTGVITITASNASVKVSILRLPAGYPS